KLATEFLARTIQLDTRAQVTKLFRLILLLFIVASCGSLSKNFVKKGTIGFPGGTYQNEKWDDVLTFSRTGWYHDMNLYFEVMATRPVEKSPFTQWFSENERQMISDCSDFFIALTYELDSERLSQTHFREEMQR